MNDIKKTLLNDYIIKNLELLERATTIELRQFKHELEELSERHRENLIMALKLEYLEDINRLTNLLNKIRLWGLHHVSDTIPELINNILPYNLIIEWACDYKKIIDKDMKKNGIEAINSDIGEFLNECYIAYIVNKETNKVVAAFENFNDIYSYYMEKYDKYLDYYINMLNIIKKEDFKI